MLWAKSAQRAATNPATGRTGSPADTGPIAAIIASDFADCPLREARSGTTTKPGHSPNDH